MCVFRLVKEDRTRYLTIDKEVIENPDLSFKAKGIHAYLMSKPLDWKIRLRDIVSHGQEGEEAVRTGLRELATHGYAKLQRGGSDGGGVWSIYETKALFTDMAKTATSGESDMAKTPTSGKPELRETAIPPSSSCTNNESVLNNEGITKERRSRSFQKPSLDEIEKYMLEIEFMNGSRAEKFIDYYESIGWHVGKNKMVDWKATVRQWKRREMGTSKDDESWKQAPR